MSVLAKVIVLDRIEVLEDGTLQFRYARYVTEDGKRISSAEYHRSVVTPGQELAGAKLRLYDDPALIDLDDRVKTVAAAIWTPDVVKTYRDRLDAFVAEAIAANATRRADAIAVAAEARPE